MPMRLAKSSGCLISGDTMQPSELVNNDNKGSVGMGACGDGATADYFTTPGQPTSAGVLAEEMGAWTQNLAAFSTANASA